MRWAWHVARMEYIRNANTILVGKPDWKRPLRRRRLRWEDNIRIYFSQIEWDIVDWMHLAQDSVFHCLLWCSICLHSVLCCSQFFLCSSDSNNNSHKFSEILWDIDRPG